MAAESSDQDLELNDIELEVLAEKIVALLLKEIALEVERTGR